MDKRIDSIMKSYGIKTFELEREDLFTYVLRTDVPASLLCVDEVRQAIPGLIAVKCEEMTKKFNPREYLASAAVVEEINAGISPFVSAFINKWCDQNHASENALRHVKNILADFDYLTDSEKFELLLFICLKFGQ